MCMNSGRHSISHIIIDGYNVIGISHKDIEKTREEFVDLLVEYKKMKPHDITLVFDGHKSGAGIENVAVRGGVRIIYSKLGVRADDVIKRIISNERREWIVVSSDRAVANHAWSVDSIPVPSDKFFDIISKHAHINGRPEETGKEAAGMDTDDEDDSETRHQKGNPHRLSKKEKAVKRALSKL